MLYLSRYSRRAYQYLELDEKIKLGMKDYENTTIKDHHGAMKEAVAEVAEARK